MEPLNRDIVNNVLNGTATKDEARRVACWFSSTIEGQQYLSDLLDKDAYQMEMQPDTGKSLSPLQSDHLYKKIEKTIYEKRMRKITLKVAAILLPILFIGAFAYFFNGNTNFITETTYAELYVPKGEDARLYFQDGTEIFLNADTRLRYPEKFGLKRREVWLDGEAYFNVASNKKRPFVVNAQNTSTTVTGTSFNVKAYSDSEIIQVVRDEGKTSFHVQQSSFQRLPGQQIEYNKSTGRTELRNLVRPSNASLWKNNVIYFYDTPLAEVMKVLERKYNVAFLVQSPEALDYSYTLTTKQATIDDVLQELQKITPVKFERQENEVYVSL
jgi:ferric-dicitrate binding protein FerR (iron transport regulator)